MSRDERPRPKLQIIAGRPPRGRSAAAKWLVSQKGRWTADRAPAIAADIVHVVLIIALLVWLAGV